MLQQSQGRIFKGKVQEYVQHYRHCHTDNSEIMSKRALFVSLSRFPLDKMPLCSNPNEATVVDVKPEQHVGSGRSRSMPLGT